MAMFGKKNDLDDAGLDPTAASDRELPSVNGSAEKKGGGAGKIVLLVGGVALVGLLMAMNMGKSRQEVASEKREKLEAKENAVTGKMPQLEAPEAPPVAPLIGGVAVAPAPGGQVPALGQEDAAAQGNAVPLTGNQGYASGSPAQGMGSKKDPKDMSTEELIRERRLTSAVAMEFDTEGGDSSGGGNDNASSANQGRPDANMLMAQAMAARGQGGAAGGGEAGEAPAAGGADLQGSLQPTRTEGTVAALVFDRNYMVAKGSFMDCVLETRLDSTVPGMTSCVLSRNIYSDNGKVILMERGSRVVGQYQGGLKQGQARIFVLWSRVQTPKGVVVDLNSPGTDALGASGMDGFVDTQFWKRFGGAILLSLIDDVAAYAANRNQDSDGNAINFENSSSAAQDMSAEALKNSINIPPVLRKNQGDHINIYVARDLDFRSVYALRSR